MKRFHLFVLALAATALMGAGAFAQVDPSPAGEPGGAAMTPAQMQTQAQTPSPAQTLSPAQTTTTTPRNDGFGWGWIGLLGLAGLAGLRRNETHPVERDTAFPAKRTDGTTPLGGVR